MKIKAMALEFDPSVSLYLVPETDVERTLLQSLWKHGEMEITNGVADGTGQGYCITTRKAEGKSDG